MSVARGFGLNGKSFYTNVVKPCAISMNFTVTPSNGLGITSLKSNGYVENVFMHTSTTPTSNNGFLNPNPAVGFALIQLKQNFNVFLGVSGWSFNVPTATSTKIDNSVLTIGQAYVISILGDSTLALWQSVGLPKGVTPAVGVSFIATAIGSTGEANTSTSRVMLPTTSLITAVEVVGNPTLSSNSNIASNAGEWVLIQFMAATSSSVTTLIPTAPATTSICSIRLLFDGSTVTIDGL